MLTEIVLGEKGEKPRSREELEIRVLRALATQRTPGIVRSISLAAKSSWPQYVYDIADIQAQKELIEDDPPKEEFVPTMRDRGDWWLVLCWFAWIDPPKERHPGRELWDFNRYQRVVWWRSFCPPYSWQWIAREIGQSPTTARNWYGAGIDMIWSESNMSRGPR